MEAPAARLGQAAAWIGDSLLVWGGYDGNYLGTGGRYCACESVAYYRDADGDGLGDPAALDLSCDIVPGYVTDGTDCDDADAGIWGAPSEVPGLCSVSRTMLTGSSPSSAGADAIVYDVLRSETPFDFVGGATCIATNVDTAHAFDGQVPPSGVCFFYLARAENGCANGAGSLGAESDGTPRAGRGCP